MIVFTNIGLPKVGREMWKLANRVSGESAALEAAILIGKWVARGLSLPVLEAIRTNVFNVSAPAGPWCPGSRAPTCGRARETLVTLRLAALAVHVSAPAGP